jgi:hypothetical protein
MDPAHSGIHGNEMADSAAKAALKNSVDNREPIAAMAIIRFTNQQFATPKYGNRTRPHIPDNIPRAHQVALSRWRTGYTRYTHGYRIEKTDLPRCEECDEILNTTHCLFSCKRYDIQRHTTGLTDRHFDGSREGTERLYIYLQTKDLIKNT